VTAPTRSTPLGVLEPGDLRATPAVRWSIRSRTYRGVHGFQLYAPRGPSWFVSERATAEAMRDVLRSDPNAVERAIDILLGAAS
jgi:hypothetical protein